MPGGSVLTFSSVGKNPVQFFRSISCEERSTEIKTNFIVNCADFLPLCIQINRGKIYLHTSTHTYNFFLSFVTYFFRKKVSTIYMQEESGGRKSSCQINYCLRVIQVKVARRGRKLSGEQFAACEFPFHSILARSRSASCKGRQGQGATHITRLHYPIWSLYLSGISLLLGTYLPLCLGTARLTFIFCCLRPSCSSNRYASACVCCVCCPKKKTKGKKNL